MAEYLLTAAGFVLAMVALGLLRILRGPGTADSLMAAQLLGTGGIAALLLLGAATSESAVVDVALTLALLSAFASVAFVTSAATVLPDRVTPDRVAPDRVAPDRVAPTQTGTERDA